MGAGLYRANLALQSLAGGAEDFIDEYDKRSRAEKQAKALEDSFANIPEEDRSRFSPFAESIKLDPEHASKYFDEGMASYGEYNDNIQRKKTLSAYGQQLQKLYPNDPEIQGLAGLIESGGDSKEIMHLIESTLGSRQRERHFQISEAGKDRRSKAGGGGGGKKTTIKDLGMKATDFEKPSDAIRYQEGMDRYELEDTDDDGKYELVDPATRKGRRTGAGGIDDLVQPKKRGAISGFLQNFGL